jgi:hypothetical protein
MTERKSGSIWPALMTLARGPSAVITLRWEGPMDIAIIFEWFAHESVLAAELANEQAQREVWLKLALMGRRHR